MGSEFLIKIKPEIDEYILFFLFLFFVKYQSHAEISIDRCHNYCQYLLWDSQRTPWNEILLSEIGLKSM